jgi:hypothetical protein
MEGGEEVGHLDIHYSFSEAFGTLVLARELPEERLREVIDQINEDLVLTSGVTGEDLFLRVYVGQEVAASYADDLLRDEFLIDTDTNGDELG